jgi:hypothetical protein
MREFVLIFGGLLVYDRDSNSCEYVQNISSSKRQWKVCFSRFCSVCICQKRYLQIEAHLTLSNCRSRSFEVHGVHIKWTCDSSIPQGLPYIREDDRKDYMWKP